MSNAEIEFSVVIPVYNEEASLDELVKRCLAACESAKGEYEIVLIDDGSRDKSAQMIADYSESTKGRVVGVILTTNFGQHAAVTAGFAHARGKYIITLDADLQNPPEEIPNVLAELRKGADVVGTIRANRKDTLFRKVASKTVNYIAREVTGVHMRDYGCMLRGYSRQVVNAVLQCKEHSKFIPILANNFARKSAEITVGHAERAVGDSKYSLWKLVNLQFDLLTGMTTFPLRLLSVFGCLVAFAGLLCALTLLVLRIIQGAEWAGQGVFTIFAVLFMFIGGQFIAMGLLGEYIGRIYHDVRGRPQFFVERVTGREAAPSSK